MDILFILVCNICCAIIQHDVANESKAFRTFRNYTFLSKLFQFELIIQSLISFRKVHVSFCDRVCYIVRVLYLKNDSVKMFFIKFTFANL